ncbi:MAG: hypothetical protein IIZ33_09510 [Erysipelotrichaceae bacterium]|nr:hypothetical protein [Erysipelotrichaceae bacterium]
MRRSTSTEIIYKIAGFLFLLLAWQLLAEAVGEREFIFPGPRESFARAWEMLQGEYVYHCILETFKRMLCGFVISLLLALLLGIPAGNHEEFRLFLSPAITTLKAIPTASLVYLFLVLSGARNTPLYIVVLISFPILYESVIGGIRSLPESLGKALRIDGGGELSNTLKVNCLWLFLISWSVWPPVSP